MSCDLSYIIYVLSITYSSGSSTVEEKNFDATDSGTSTFSCTPTLVFVGVEIITEVYLF